MPKLDELKEQLGMLKFWLGVVVGVMTAMCGWVASNYAKIDILFLLLSVIILIILALSVIKINILINKKIRQIGRE
nr:hypothetical protein [Campylobacter sp.]